MRRREPDTTTPADLTPMIDVTFLLLVFFLCTLRFQSFETKLAAHLPKDVGHADFVEPRLELDVAIEVRVEGERRDPADLTRPWSGVGPFELVGRELEFRVGPRRFEGAAALLGTLRAAAARDPETPVVLHAGVGVVQADVILTLDLLAAAGLFDVRFAGPR